MGAYTDRLTRRNKGGKPTHKNHDAERLVSVAIVRAGETHSRGFKSHANLRAALGDEDPYTHTPGDVDGFLTSKGRFVDREEGRMVGEASRQVTCSSRELLSSDISW